MGCPRGSTFRLSKSRHPNSEAHADATYHSASPSWRLRLTPRDCRMLGCQRRLYLEPRCSVSTLILPYSHNVCPDPAPMRTEAATRCRVRKRRDGAARSLAPGVACSESARRPAEGFDHNAYAMASPKLSSNECWYVGHIIGWQRDGCCCKGNPFCSDGNSQMLSHGVFYTCSCTDAVAKHW